MNNVNRQVFNTSKENYKEHLNRLLETLFAYNTDFANEGYNDIHIYQEEMFIIVEWTEVPYLGEWGGRFKFVDEDEAVMKEVNFPDGHYEFVFPEDVDETLKEWHEKHPEWVKTSYGVWTNVEENRINYIDMVLKDEFKNKETKFETISETNLVEELKKDRRLHRADYIVCSASLASTLSAPLMNECTGTNTIEKLCSVHRGEGVFKHCILDLKLDLQQFDESKPVEYYDTKLPIYICESLKADEFALCLDTGHKWFYKIRNK